MKPRLCGLFFLAWCLSLSYYPVVLSQPEASGILPNQEGEFPVGVKNTQITMSTGYTADVIIYYPGYLNPIEKRTRDEAAPFPVVIFSPGYGGTALQYGTMVGDLATYGFVVAGVSWQYEDNREDDVTHLDHIKVIDMIRNMSASSDSPLFNLADTDNCGAFGHSRGARTAFMSSGFDPRIKAISAWMPTLNNGSEVDQSDPKLLFCGEYDTTAWPNLWTDPLYESCDPTIIYVNVTGGNHQPNKEIHEDITNKFFRYHLGGETELESNLYGDTIKARAEDGEFHLKMKTFDGEYDSDPLTPPVIDGIYPVFIDHTQITTSSGDTVNMVLYYPGYGNTSGREKRDDQAPFPVVIFSPGAGGTATDYENIVSDLASYGFIVAGVSWIYESDREKDTAHLDHTIAIDHVRDLSFSANSPLYGLADTDNCGAYGHSRGARVAYMASGIDDRIKAICAWMPTLNNGSDVNQDIPKLLFAGEVDMVASPSQWTDPLYDSCDPEIIYVNVTGMGHEPTEQTHEDITNKFFRYHLLGEGTLESDLYGYRIKTRAENGEFHLRIKTEEGEFDSDPPTSQPEDEVPHEYPNDNSSPENPDDDSDPVENPSSENLNDNTDQGEKQFSIESMLLIILCVIITSLIVGIVVYRVILRTKIS